MTVSSSNAERVQGASAYMSVRECENWSLYICCWASKCFVLRRRRRFSGLLLIQLEVGTVVMTGVDEFPRGDANVHPFVLHDRSPIPAVECASNSAKREKNISYSIRWAKFATINTKTAMMFTYPSAANSTVLRAAFSWISIALDHSRVRTRLLYSVLIGIGTTSTVSLKLRRLFLLFLPAFVFSV